MRSRHWQVASVWRRSSAQYNSPSAQCSEQLPRGLRAAPLHEACTIISHQPDRIRNSAALRALIQHVFTVTLHANATYRGSIGTLLLAASRDAP